MIAPSETFDGTWPFAPCFHEVPATGDSGGFRMHYVDERMCDKAIPPAAAIADFEGVWPGRPIVRLPGAGHF